jgi:DNA replication terminus site-binding protein
MIRTLTYEQAHVAKELTPVFNELEASINDLIGLLSKATLVAAKVFEVPRVPKEQEDVHAPRIECTAVLGQEAFKLAKKAYLDFYMKEGMSSKFVYRCPGVIQLKADVGLSDAIDFMVRRVNGLKIQFADLVDSLGDRDTKFEVVHHCFRSIITMQVTRRIYLKHNALQSVGFTWGQNTSSNRLSKDAAIKYLERAGKYTRKVDGPLSWDELVERDIRKLQGLPSSAQLSKRRVLRPVTMMNVRDADGKNLRLDGGLPLIVLNQKSNFKINTLNPYDLEKRRRLSKRSDKQVCDEPFIEYFNLYLVK